uniref:Uncharacterized protein n=1 Tax=Populus trichocarpa TaxID=3694 RepID=A0A2K1X266_POPTR
MALYDSVTCGKASKKKDLADEDSESKQRREWNDLVLNEGTELFYTEEKERSNGVLAICAAKSAAPSYISLATISSL